ncbi:hypothetical protein L6452_05538 [Arctium lappa]|uniref:Uncharacterized protein n=1 Tax=Arctium lappa TaxID=4217 RepID=A0ACB9EHR2_ARCLA|nr:hypothetical protein L6452_05538 [Arctium lappa]
MDLPSRRSVCCAFFTSFLLIFCRYNLVIKFQLEEYMGYDISFLASFGLVNGINASNLFLKNKIDRCKSMEIQRSKHISSAGKPKNSSMEMNPGTDMREKRYRSTPASQQMDDRWCFKRSETTID